MLSISSTIRKTETQDGAVLLDLARGEMYSLNPVGSKILELIGTGSDEDEIVLQMSALTGAEIEMVRSDVREFIEAVTRLGIVHRRERATGGSGEPW